MALLSDAVVLTHPMELALGSIRDRLTLLALRADLPGIPVATHDEVLRLVQSHALFGTSLSLVDAHLLTGLRLSLNVQLWTRDRRLHVAAQRLGVAAQMT